jgi:hypothetical protein
MAGKSANSIGAKNWSPNSPATRYNVSGKNREFYTFENAPGISAYATGGTIIDGGDGYIYHIFTGTGIFEANRPPAAIDSVDYLIVAGGGGASATFSDPGGGGGGGMLFGNALIGSGPYAISVGAGGPSSPNVTSSTRNGTPSSAFGVTASGGGGGGEPGTPAAQRAGSPGGSGGGGGATPGSPPVITTSGSAIDTVPRQGYPAGTPQPSLGVNRGGTGGGGAGGLGAQGTGPPALGGAGGPGKIAPEFPSTIVRQAIPAPVLPTWEPLVGPGGYSRGGNGFPFPTSQNSPNNSGYGGSDLAGGSGIVCVRYKKTAPYSRATGGTIEPSTDPEHPGVFRHIFTSPGDFIVTDPTLQYVDYLAVGGGGGGGGSPLLAGGGGGAGGFVSSIHTSTTTPTSIPEAYPWNPGYSVRVGEQYPVGVGTYPIGIGTGGNAATAGNNTTIGSPGPAQIIAAGGGLGGTEPQAGGAGGSGGGGAKGPAPGNIFGGTATPTPLIQGNNGGVTTGTSLVESGSGGGGAGASGGSGPSWAGGNGWYSVLSPSAYGTPGPLTPTTIYRYFAGGGGGVLTPPATSYPGGAGGGGTGNVSGAGTPGTTNTGGGGGGGYGALGGSGGPGIVIIQYPE